MAFRLAFVTIFYRRALIAAASAKHQKYNTAYSSAV